MNVGTSSRKSIRRPVSVISAAAGEPPIQITQRQLTIGKMIGAAIGAAPVVFLLLSFNAKTGPADSGRPAVVAEPGGDEVARIKAETEADARGRAGTFFTSCTTTPSGEQYYHELSYRNGKVQDSSSTRCAAK